MPTALQNQDLYPLTYSQIEKKLKDVKDKLAAKGADAVKSPELRETLTSAQAKLAKALKEMADKAATRKRQHDKYRTEHAKWEKNGGTTSGKTEPVDKSGYITTWKKIITYGQTKNGVQKFFNGADSIATKGMDFLEDKKGIIATVGVAAAVMGVANTYIPQLLAHELKEGITFTVGGKEVVAKTIGEVVKTFFAANPQLAAGLNIAGIAAVALAIPAIRSKIRNSAAYKGKALAREETAKLRAEVLDLNEGQEHNKIIEFYATQGMEIDDKGHIKVDPELVKIAAQDEKVLEALEKDFTDNGAKMPAESRGKLAQLIKEARTKRAEIVSAATKASNQAEYESEVNVTMNEQVIAVLACTDTAKTTALETAKQDFITAQKAVETKQAAYDTALKAWEGAGNPTSGTEFDAKNNAKNALTAAKSTLDSKVAAFKGAFEAITDAAGKGKFDKYKSSKNLQNQFSDAELCNLINMKLDENALTRT